MEVSRECKHPCCGPVCRKKKPKPRRKPIRRYSKKRQKENRTYSTLRKQFLEANPECEARLKMCIREATDIHHMCGRVGDNLLDTETWLPVCRPCHLWIESHPEQAKQLGLSESRLQKLKEVQKGIYQ